MSENRLLKAWGLTRSFLLRLTPFWFIYGALIFLFFLHPLKVGWDPSEYLAFGKWLFSGGTVGYASWHRPLMWPLLLGSLWRLQFPMPLTMQVLSTLLYFAIPLVTYFRFRDGRRYIGLVVATQPFFFQFSHLPLSHILATLFLLCAFMTDGWLAGVFAVLAGFSRFTFFLYLPFSLLYGKWKQKATGAAALLTPYAIVMLLLFGTPFLQFTEASGIINHPDFLWVWQGDLWFYPMLMLRYSPLLLLAFTNKKPSTLAFFGALVYFTLLPHKEPRFFIDILVYGALALGENFRRAPWVLATFHLLFLSFMGPVYEPPAEIFLLVPDGVTVIGMEPGINSYRDVVFTPWFHFSGEPDMNREYCVFSASAVPCQEGYELCESHVAIFRDTCRSWDVLWDEGGFVVARNPAQTAE